MKKFKFLEHTADVKFQAFGKSLNECFENAAKAMFAVMAEKVRGKGKRKDLKAKGDDLPALLYNFLEELIFFMETEDLFLKDVKVAIKKEDRFLLEAQVKGGKASEQEVAIVVKAVTYNQMFIKEEGKGRDKRWIAQVVVDV